MGETKGTNGQSMKIDTQLVRELADMLTETGLTEIEVEDGDRKIRVSRGGMAAQFVAAAPAAPASAKTPRTTSAPTPPSPPSRP